MKIGIETLTSAKPNSKDWGSCLLLCNQASLTRDFIPSWEVFHDLLGDQLKGFLGPQHGFLATVQDNMIETTHSKGPYDLPVYSLYSETREPTDEMLEGVDTILIDLQITGCRVYTFKYTIAGCLRRAQKLGKRVVLFDRPNPLGGVAVEGRVLDADATSFVGQFQIPMRHGLTAGEAARYFNQGIGAELDVIPLEGWDPHHYWHQLERPWVLTSPNLPTIDGVYTYPGTVLLEGCNLSEGRGTGHPFLFIGAPYIKDAEEYTHRVAHHYRSEGVHLRPTFFMPTSQKWQDETCRGLQIHVTSPKDLRSYRLGLALLAAGIESGGFEFTKPPYEYDYETLPMKLIVGNRSVDERLTSQFNIDDDFWTEGIEGYIGQAKEVLLYERSQILFK